MDAYHLALFLHVVTLLVAAGATAVTKLAAGRRLRARTVGEALEWQQLLIAASRLFPLCLVLFLVTGGFMLGNGGRAAWSSGFVVSGLVGVILLLASGTFLGIEAKGFKQYLEGVAARGADGPVPAAPPPMLVAMLPAINAAIALAVVFDMVMKPASVAVALGVIGIGIVIAGIGTRRRPVPSRAAAGHLASRAPNDGAGSSDLAAGDAAGG